MEVLTHTLLHALEDTGKMIPFLFLAYLVIEYVEQHHSQGLERMLSTQSRYGFVVGTVLGCFPQCGFSAMAANLYGSKVITLGTLIAVFLCTSDEAIPLLLATPGRLPVLGKLLGVKIAAALITGLVLDVLLPRRFRLTSAETGGYDGSLDDCDCHDHQEGSGVLVAAVRHTVNIFVVIFLLTVVIGFVVETVGEDTLAAWLAGLGPLQVFAAALVGFIPNCAVSVLLTQLYLAGDLAFGAAVAGLCTSAGVGLLVLLRSNRSQKDNLKVLAILYGVSVVTGWLCLAAGL